MLGSLRHLKRINNLVAPTLSLIRFNSSAAIRQAEKKWDIMAAVCIERPPYIAPALSELEQKMFDTLEQKELEESMLNDHEVRHKYVENIFPNQLLYQLYLVEMWKDRKGRKRGKTWMRARLLSQLWI